jgi:hypothetical protein
VDGIELIMNWKDFKSIIIHNLSDDLLNKKFYKIKRDDPFLCKTFGHCYIVSEAAYYLLGGKEEGWKPYFVRHDGYPHWFLKHKSGFVLDLTEDQFVNPVNHSKGIGKGFLTRQVSRRTKLLLRRIDGSAAWNFVKSRAA